MTALTATIECSRSNPFVLDSARFAPANRRHVSGPGLRTFLAIADRWGLTENERLLTLGAPSRSTYYGWVKAARDHRDLMLPTEGEGTDRLPGPHQGQPFAGQPPIALITGGMQDGLMAVRRFLDAARGGQWMAPNDADLAEPMTDKDIVVA